jgi:hypothetical protein
MDGNNTVSIWGPIQGISGIICAIFALLLWAGITPSSILSWGRGAVKLEPRPYSIWVGALFSMSLLIPALGSYTWYSQHLIAGRVALSILSLLVFLNWVLVWRSYHVAPEPPKLVIHSANYAAWSGRGARRDVARFLRSIINGDSLVFGPIENHSFLVNGENLVPQDPMVGDPKRLEITYSYDGETPKTIQRAEHSRLVLPEDSTIEWQQQQIEQLKTAQPKGDTQELAQISEQCGQLREQLSTTQREAKEFRDGRNIVYADLLRVQGDLTQTRERYTQRDRENEQLKHRIDELQERWNQSALQSGEFMREADVLYGDTIFAWLREQIHTSGTIADPVGLSQSVGLPEPAVRRGLGNLKSRGIVDEPKSGVWTYAAGAGIGDSPKYKIVPAGGGALFSPLQVEILALVKALDQFSKEFEPPPPISNNSEEHVAWIIEHNHWGTRLEHAYADQFSARVTVIAHKLGAKGFPVEDLNAKIRSMDAVAKVSVGLRKLFWDADYHP